MKDEHYYVTFEVYADAIETLERIDGLGEHWLIGDAERMRGDVRYLGTMADIQRMQARLMREDGVTDVVVA